MLSRYVSAFALTATLGVFAGCSESPDSYAGNEGEEVPAPSQSTMNDTREDTGGMNDQMAGNQTGPESGMSAQDSGMAGDTSGSMAGNQTGDSSMMDESSGEDSVSSSEFAAFDTNSDGELSKQEFQSEDLQSQVDLKNRTFEQLDRDSDGALGPQEFQNAKTSPTQGQSGGLNPTSTD